MNNELVLKDLQAKAARWNWLMSYLMSDEIRYDAALRECKNVEEVAVVVDRAIAEIQIGGIYEEEEENA